MYARGKRGIREEERKREREGTKRERTYVRTYVRSVIRGKTGRCASDASRRVVGKRLTPWRPPAPPDAAHAPYLKQLVHPCSQCSPKTTGDFIFFDKKPVNLPPSPPPFPSSSSSLPLLPFSPALALFYLFPLLIQRYSDKITILRVDIGIYSLSFLFFFHSRWERVVIWFIL